MSVRKPNNRNLIAVLQKKSCFTNKKFWTNKKKIKLFSM